MTTPRRVLVIGAGRVARALARRPWPLGLQAVYQGRSVLDLTTADLDDALDRAGADAVINTAAWTDVDGAEAHRTEAWAVNANAPARLAEATRRRGAALVHLSTDYVFGQGEGPWSEGAYCAPLNVYGESKRAGEQEVLARDPAAWVVRTAWLFDGASPNFLTAILARREDATLGVITDQRGSPTFTDDLADGLLALLSSQGARADMGEVAGGPRDRILHFANGGEGVTRLQMAQAVFQAALRPGEAAPTLQPILSSEWPSAALRPADSRLSIERWVKRGLPVPRLWTEAIAAAVVQVQRHGGGSGQ